MSSREGRGRSRRDYPSLRSEEKSHHGRGNNPPSRHLWAGNISHSISENTLAHHFLRYGDLESIAFQPGRSYAFINYINEEDAFAAIKDLQGFVIGGNQLKIEFAKPEKSSPPSRDADHFERRDDRYPKLRESPYSQRDSRARHASPDPLHPNKSKTDDKDTEPSEVLWVGFPPHMKIDEFVLRKAFSPFGEIEKITAFPGRTYGFVRFRNVMAAVRAKETLHRKLFGNPRVHICFAKNESGLSNRERITSDAPLSPRFRSYGHEESFVRHGRNFGYGDHSKGSPPYIPDLDTRERMRFPVRESEVELPGNIYEPMGSPKRNVGVRIREFSPQDFPRKGPIYDDPWDLPEDVSFLHGPKKLKSESTFPPDNELPEYPLFNLEKSKRVLPHDIPRSGPTDKDYESGHVAYRPIVPQHLMNSTQPFGERIDHWNSPHDEFQVGPAQLSLVDRRRLTPEKRQPSSKEVWKWEGRIAKGGNPICCARCFPVGKPPDMILPEYLDCTARTSLDMLAKNYYQATSAFVVFFAPADDPDISYYNEFMNYLGERQRAAVVKLDERTTLFLVPPSEFSEKVLKVPGRLSISGVVLSLDSPGSSYGPTPPTENRELSSFTSFHGDLAHQKPFSLAGPYLPTPPLANYEKPKINAGPIHGNSSSGYFNRSNPLTRIGSVSHPYPAIPRPPAHEATHSNYTPDSISGYPPVGGNGKLPMPENASSAPVEGLLPEQLTQLASSLLGQQQGQFGQSGNSLVKTSQHYGVKSNEQVPLDLGQSQFGQMEQQPSQGLGSGQANQQQFQNAVQEDGGEADPQKRLQATLQLAAALLQQIKQGKGT